MGKLYANKLVKGNTKYKVISDIPTTFQQATIDALNEMLESGKLSEEEYNRIMEIEE